LPTRLWRLLGHDNSWEIAPFPTIATALVATPDKISLQNQNTVWFLNKLIPNRRIDTGHYAASTSFACHFEHTAHLFSFLSNDAGVAILDNLLTSISLTKANGLINRVTLMNLEVILAVQNVISQPLALFECHWKVPICMAADIGEVYVMNADFTPMLKDNKNIVRTHSIFS
jgi:uncharacterized integral membrane protein